MSSVAEVFNYIFAGKTVRLQFATSASAESFRTQLFRYKKTQDLALSILDETPDQLRFSYNKATGVATIKLAPPTKRVASFEILSVDD